jgi:hypothetical protein
LLDPLVTYWGAPELVAECESCHAAPACIFYESWNGGLIGVSGYLCAHCTRHHMESLGAAFGGECDERCDGV